MNDAWRQFLETRTPDERASVRRRHMRVVRELPPERPRVLPFHPPGYVPVQEQIVKHLQEQGGLIEDTNSVAQRIGIALGLPARRVRAALGALQARGLLDHDQTTAVLSPDGLIRRFVTKEPVHAG